MEEKEDKGKWRDDKGLFLTGNKFAEGLENSGRKPFYATHEELAEGIASYFQSVRLRSGKYKATVSGLAFHLGFKSRFSMYDYIERAEEFAYIIERAKLKIEECFETNLYDYNWSGAAYWLSNHGWDGQNKNKGDGDSKGDTKEVWDVTLNLKGQ